MLRKNGVKCVMLGLAACLLLTACHPKTDPNRNDGFPGGNTSTPGSNAGNVDPNSPDSSVSDWLKFNYGRLTLSDRFLKQSSNGVDITLNFEKKIYTPGDDIVLTAYVANYTGDAIQFALQDPIVSRQQLIHDSLTYGPQGQYSVPVTVEFSEEADLIGGKYEVEVKNRKLLATTITFHTSAYENIEDSIFSQDYADTYEMHFWFGEDEYEYRHPQRL